MSQLDSTAVFSARLIALGLGDLTNDMAIVGYNTLANFAFAANYTPNAPDDSAFQAEVIIPLLGEDRARIPALRRLHFEANVMFSAEMHQRTVRGEDAAPRRLAPAERAARFAALKANYTGIDFVNELEPSYKLVDKLVAMYETGELRFLKWEELTRL